VVDDWEYNLTAGWRFLFWVPGACGWANFRRLGSKRFSLSTH